MRINISIDTPALQYLLVGYILLQESVCLANFKPKGGVINVTTLFELEVPKLARVQVHFGGEFANLFFVS